MRTTDRAFAIDANVILRYLIPDDSELCAKAERILDSVAQGKLTVSCDPVILAEVVLCLLDCMDNQRNRRLRLSIQL